MRRNPLSHISGAFKDTLLNCFTFDKEGYAILATFRRTEFMLRRGVQYLYDHCKIVVSLAVFWRLEH